MPAASSSPLKSLLARLLRIVGLENTVRDALARRRSPARTAARLAKIRAEGASVQYLMDIHPASLWHNANFVARFGGFSPPGETRVHLADVFVHDRTRSDQITLLLRELEVRQVPGAMAELGVHRGASARLLHHYCPRRKLYLFDTFEGFAPTDLAAESLDLGYNKAQSFTDTSIALALKHIAPVNDNVVPIPGWFPASIPEPLYRETFAFVHLDADLEEPIHAGLVFFAPRLSPGGFILVHDYNAWPGARLAVDRFIAAHPGWTLVPLADKSGSALLSRPLQATDPAPPPSA